MNKSRNPLSGKVYFDKDGNLWMEKGILFGGQMKPKVRPREWFYLVFESCKEHGLPKKNMDKVVQNWIGSSVTRWRTKKSLQAKGYLN